MSKRVAPWVRVAFMLIGVTTVGALSYCFTGGVFPSDSRQSLVFQNALLLIVLGSAVLEHHFTKPADSAVNSLMGFITLLSVYSVAPRGPWLAVAGYCVAVFILSVTCIATSSSSSGTGWQKQISYFTYRPAIVFGRSRILFSVVFLSGLWFFYSVQDSITLVLVIFWGLFLAIWPLRIPQLITAWFDSPHDKLVSVGVIVRIDNPNILRVGLAGEATWDLSTPKICSLPNGSSFWVHPLFSEFQDGRLLATGLLTSLPAPNNSPQRNCVVEPGEGVMIPTSAEISDALGGGVDAQLVGCVVEHSAIQAIRFETQSPECCYDGMLVWSLIDGTRVYYQIVSGETHEESFAADKHGFQVATAVQLGTLEPQQGFSQ